MRTASVIRRDLGMAKVPMVRDAFLFKRKASRRFQIARVSANAIIDTVAPLD